MPPSPRADVNASMKPSPTPFTTVPPCSSVADVTTWLCAWSTSSQAWSPNDAFSAVEPSMSVNTRVTVPSGATVPDRSGGSSLRILLRSSEVVSSKRPTHAVESSGSPIETWTNTIFHSSCSSWKTSENRSSSRSSSPSFASPKDHPNSPRTHASTSGSGTGNRPAASNSTSTYRLFRSGPRMGGPPVANDVISVRDKRALIAPTSPRSIAARYRSVTERSSSDCSTSLRPCSDPVVTHEQYPAHSPALKRGSCAPLPRPQGCGVAFLNGWRPGCSIEWWAL